MSRPASTYAAQRVISTRVAKLVVATGALAVLAALGGSGRAVAQERLAGLARLHASLNPDAVLQRGYVRVTGADGATLTSRAAAADEASLTLHFRDGELKVASAGAPASSAPTRSKPAPKAPPPEQGKLL